MKNILQNKLFLFFKVLFLILLLLFMSYIPIILFKIDINSLTKLEKVLYNLITDLIFLGILIYVYRKTLIEDFKNFKKNLSSNLEFAFKYWLIGVIVMIVSNILITVFAPTSTAGNEETIRSLINQYPIYMLFCVAIYAPLTEELIFRKGFRDLINNKYIYILASGMVFGSLHVVSTITSPLDLLYLIPYCSLGITFAYIYYKSKNIFSTISMHCFHNTITVCLYLIGLALWKKQY